VRLEAGRGGPGGERGLITALFFAGLGGLLIANLATRGRAIYCPACRTPNLAAFVRTYRYRCNQCAAEFTRIGLQFVREGGQPDEETIPHATAKLKDD
jgi:hypothetical protein